MKSLVSIDYKNRKLFSVNEIKFKVEKLLKQNNLILKFQKWDLLLQDEFKLNNFKVRLKNRCIISGRGSSISRIYSISRIQFRELGRDGSITGLMKSSW